MLHSFCYVSSSKNLSAIDLEQLFYYTKRNNTELGISGLLIYNSGNFLQVLEGSIEKVNTLFNKISQDQRHSNIIKLIDSELEERIFQDYEVGFVVVNNKEKLRKLKDYLDWIKQAEIESVDKVVGIVENFIDNKFIHPSN